MIGILVTSHGNFCIGIINALEMISGKNDSIHCVNLDDNGIGDYSKRLNGKLDQLVKKYNNVIIFTDIVGGTPYNLCYQYILEKNSSIKLIAGMNLPMLIEASLGLTYTDDINDLVKLAISSGTSSISELVIEDDDNDLDI